MVVTQTRNATHSSIRPFRSSLNRRGSVSLVQRRLSIGYSRASRLVDQMAMAGILGEHKGSVAREVLISIDDWDKMQALESGEEGETNELEVVYDDDPDGLDGPVPDEDDGDFLR